MRDAEQVQRDVGRRVAELRRARGWTQAVLAERAGWTKHYIESIEAGRENLTVHSLVGVAALFGVDARALLDAPKSRAPRRRGRPKSKD